MDIDTEDTLKSAALELRELNLPRSEHHLGFLIQVHLTGRVTWGEVSSEKPYNFRTLDPRMALELASLAEADDLAALGFTWEVGEVTKTTSLYRMTPMYVVREFYRNGEWGPALRLTQQNAHGIELLLLAVHKLLEGRVVDETS